MDYLSRERVVSGQAVSDAEELVESQQRAEIIGKAIVDAWNHIVEMPDGLLVDLIAETTENICGFKPEPELVEQFLSRNVLALPDASHPTEEPPRDVLHTSAQVGGQGPLSGVVRDRPSPLPWSQQTPQISWLLCYALRKRGSKSFTLMGTVRFSPGTPQHEAVIKRYR